MSLDILPRADPTSLDAYFQHVSRVPLLSREQECELAQRIAGGERQAREQMIAANMRLVISVARRYHRPGLPMDDLVQEGAIGLMRAVDKFDYRKGYKFSTYATWWIMQAITRNIDCAYQPVRVPIHALEARRHVKRIESQMESETGVVPTIEELATRCGKSMEEVLFLQSLDFQMLSLDVPVTENGSTFAECLEDSQAVDPHEELANSEASRLVADGLATLSEREADVLRRRYGIGDYTRPQTLQGISEAYALTRERIRQIEGSALRKITRYLTARRENAV